MSLSPQQLKDTERELRDNLAKADVTVEQIAADLSTTPAYIEELLCLRPKKLEDTWILKNYLINKVKEAGKTPTKFTALGGNYHFIWFLNAKYIDGKKIY